VTGAVLAIELLAACQAMEFLRPLTTTAPLEDVYKLVRAKIPSVCMNYITKQQWPIRRGRYPLDMLIFLNFEIFPPANAVW